MTSSPRKAAGRAAERLRGQNGNKATRGCPCGYLGDGSGRCRCTDEQVRRYRSRISGPLLDRIDMQLHVPAVTADILRSYGKAGAEPSAAVRRRVAAAFSRQLARSGKPNGRLDGTEVERCCGLTNAQRQLLSRAVDRLRLSARAMHRLLKVARTIADLDAEDRIGDGHLSEAISYRDVPQPAITAE